MSQDDYNFAGFRALENEDQFQQTNSQPLSQESQESDFGQSAKPVINKQVHKFVSSSSSEEEVNFTSDEEKENEFREPVSNKHGKRTVGKGSRKKSGKEVQSQESAESVTIENNTALLKNERDYIKYLQGLSIKKTDHVEPALDIITTLSNSLPTSIFKQSGIPEKYHNDIRQAIDLDIKSQHRANLAFPNIMSKLAQRPLLDIDNFAKDVPDNNVHKRKIQILESLHCWMSESLETAKSLERKVVREINSTGKVDPNTEKSLERLENMALDFQRYMKALPRRKESQ